MKSRAIILLLALAGILSACQKEIKLERKKINVTEEDSNWRIRLSHSVFSFPETSIEKACMVYNDKVEGIVEDIHSNFIENAKGLVASLDSAGIETAARYELFLTDSVYMADDKFISVLVQSYQMLGGANGNTEYYALNYDLATGKFLNKTDIIDASKAAEINTLLKSHLLDPDQCYTFEEPTIDNCSAINLSPTTVEFTYAKYILGPGACGPATISIPREKLNHALKIK